jgi:molybdopterin-guanine dinucleotide biosynthesis protein B
VSCLTIDIPVVAVVGFKDSGKTAVVEALVSKLVKKGLKPATAKHVSKKGFSMDSEGKDSWRHSAAGANPVMVFSDIEMVLKFKDSIQRLSLDAISNLAQEYGANVLVLEGFSSLVLGDKSVGKVICPRSEEEYEDFKAKARNQVLAYCSINPLEEPILNIKNGLPVVADKVSTWIEKRQRILEIMSQLPSLDCGKCGKNTCEELAQAIFEGEASVDDCIPLRLKPKIKAKLIVDGVDVPIQPFVAEVVRKSVLGMVSTLKGVSISGEENVAVTISS